MNADGEPICDIDRLKGMVDLFQGEFRGALSDFLRNTARYTGEIAAGIATQKWDDVRATSHKLKSSAAMFGFPRLGSLSAKIEASTIANKHDALPALAADLQATLAATDALVTGLRQDPPLPFENWVAGVPR